MRELQIITGLEVFLGILSWLAWVTDNTDVGGDFFIYNRHWWHWSTISLVLVASLLTGSAMYRLQSALLVPVSLWVHVGITLLGLMSAFGITRSESLYYSRSVVLWAVLGLLYLLLPMCLLVATTLLDEVRLRHTLEKKA